GYNEIYTAAIAQLNGNSRWSLDSFEIVEGLKNQFLESLHSSQEFQNSVYGSISNRLSEYLGLPQGSVYQQLNSAVLENRLKVYGDIRGFSFTQKYHAILQDAFSLKTNPDLWEENFLVELLSTTHPKSALASYASLG
ncbi:MAG: MnmC family methyltransferase, partial [Bdellovibrionales bacterium]